MNDMEAEKILDQKMIYHHSDYCSRCGHGWDCQSYQSCSECGERNYSYSYDNFEHRSGCSLIPIQKIFDAQGWPDDNT
jgi:hypothetical protein